MKLQKAFDFISPKRMFVADAIVKLKGYDGIERIVISKLWNGKIAIFRLDSFKNQDAGYKTYETEEELLGVIEIKSVMSFNQEEEINQAIQSSLTALLV